MLCVLNDEVLEKNDLSKRCDNYCLSSTWPLSEFDRHSFKVKDKIMLLFRLLMNVLLLKMRAKFCFCFQHW